MGFKLLYTDILGLKMCIVSFRPIRESNNISFSKSHYLLRMSPEGFLIPCMNMQILKWISKVEISYIFHSLA